MKWYFDATLKPLNSVPIRQQRRQRTKGLGDVIRFDIVAVDNDAKPVGTENILR